MVNVAKHDTKSVNTVMVLALAGVALLFAVITVVAITNITRDPYVGGYYSIDALFDAVGVDETALLYANVPLFSGQFYLIFAISVLDGIVKIVIVGFIIASLIDIITAVDVRARLVHMARRRLKDHYIICGYSKLAERIAEDMVGRHVPFIVLDKEPARADMIREEGYLSLHEDFTTEAALISAGIASAKAVLFLTENDYENLLGVVTARHINSKVKIIARAEDASTITKIHRAGAELCVVPEVLAGLELGESVAKRRAP